MSKEQEILAMGILSIVCCSILGPIAWFNANSALRMIDDEGYDASERTLVVAGQTCGIIGTGLLVLGILVLLLKVATGTLTPQ